MSKQVERTLIVVGVCLVLGGLLLIPILGKLGAGFEMLMCAAGTGLAISGIMSSDDRKQAVLDEQHVAALAARAEDDEE